MSIIRERVHKEFDRVTIRQISILFHDACDIFEESIRKTLEKISLIFLSYQNSIIKKMARSILPLIKELKTRIFISVFHIKLSRRKEAASLAARVYYLKALSTINPYHSVRLPAISFLDQPLGFELRSADYGEYFPFRQRCTLGGDNEIRLKLETT